MSRTNKILALLLASQLVLIAYLYRPEQSNGPPTRHFFAKITAAQVTGLTISDASRSLAITRAGDNWQLDSVPPYPADRKKIEALLDKLLALTSSRLVARTTTSHGRLQVAEETFTRKLTLGLGDGTTQTLLLGTAPNYKTIHVRLVGDDNVYLVTDLADWEASVTPDDWWANNYLDIPPAQLTQLTLVNGQGQIELHRDSDGKWQAPEAPANTPLADDALHEFLNQACLVQLSSYLGRDRSAQELGLDQPAATLTLTTGEGVTVLKLAPGDPQKEEYFAKASDSPFYVTVHAYEVKALLETGLAALLSEPQALANPGE